MSLTGANVSWKLTIFSEHSAAINLPKKKPHQSFTGCYKKLGGSGLAPRHKEYQK